jgi:biotin transport system ATP-binding protein
VTLDAVTVHRGGRDVLSDLSLQLEENRIVLIGRNGSGKTTLAQLIKGLLVPDAGSVRVWGLDPAARTAESAAAVGFLFQNSDHQILCPTVLEEIAFGPIEAGLPREEAQRASLEIMRLHGIAGWRDRAVATLSEGQRRLVCLLAVLVLEPHLLVLDEPYNGLDIPTRLRLAEFIAGLPQQILLISHDPETIEDAERALWLEEGRVQADDAPARVLPGYLHAMRHKPRGMEGAA